MVFEEHGQSAAEYEAYIEHIVAQNTSNGLPPMLYNPNGPPASASSAPGVDYQYQFVPSTPVPTGASSDTGMSA